MYLKEELSKFNIYSLREIGYNIGVSEQDIDKFLLELKKLLLKFINRS